MDELFLSPPDQYRYRLRMQAMAPYIFTEPSLFRTLGLIGTGRAKNLYPQGTQERPVVLWLKHHALNSLATAVAEQGIDAPLLAPALALMAGYEKELGESNASMMHIGALRKVMQLDEPRPERDRADYSSTRGLSGSPFEDSIDRASIPATVTQRAGPEAHDLVQVLEAAYHRGKVMPAGFHFLYTNKLLPPSLIFNVSQLAHIDVKSRVSLLSLNCIGVACCACRPWTEEGLSTLNTRYIAVEVAKWVRHVAVMLTGLLFQVADKKVVPQSIAAMSLSEGLQAASQDTQYLDLDGLVGTLYDELLLWCMAVRYICLCGRVSLDQKLTMQKLLDNLLIDRFVEFDALMGRFIKQPCMETGFYWLWHELRPEAN